MAHHNKEYSVYATGSGYKYEITESFRSETYITVSNEIDEFELKERCFPILTNVYNEEASSRATAVEYYEYAENLKTELSGSGITYNYDSWAEANYAKDVEGVYGVEVGGVEQLPHTVSKILQVTVDGNVEGTVTIQSPRMFTYNSGSGYILYSNDGHFFTTTDGSVVWKRL